MENIVLGIIQGVTEWLPISSEGVLFIVKTNFFGATETTEIIKEALFLHLGTFFAALIYLRKDVIKILEVIFEYKQIHLDMNHGIISRLKFWAMSLFGEKLNRSSRKMFWFLFLTTLISGLIGIILLVLLGSAGDIIKTSGKLATAIVGILLLVTAFIQLKAKNTEGLRNAEDINSKDTLILGLMQGLAVLPGFSRSGFTISALLLRKFDNNFALKLSFLMSLPVVLAGNIGINLIGFSFTPDMLIQLLFSFIFGMLTIHVLLKFAHKVNFGYFVLVFGIITIIASLI
ncbi:MAG: UDP-diphosphatase [Candidatus Yanofskybacteria bacterium CG10_big_fil_rev_8_21_14_0_10_36_16]|uniref:Undecaprenyl-diphosphatase n=1 Tax=Candidatus Yanofskybacteria bacterium CG10_big_fil_rev_8_21_14_0_10_36_16 TaxID=1975096 RepID=A0A2J0Q6J2_9BACT|nr:MAG: UDP-diphosphatase [Candidatus Yanofskybacteria bacterium CG10_big_fil_rev_8_21_14_0_10_36_16]